MEYVFFFFSVFFCNINFGGIGEYVKKRFFKLFVGMLLFCIVRDVFDFLFEMLLKVVYEIVSIFCI